MTAPAPITGGTIALARHLHNDGWNCAAISRYLTEQGTPVARSTVYLWTHPDHAAAHTAAASRYSSRMAARRSGGRLGRANHSDELRLQRMRSLRDLGLSFRVIAKVVSFDWPDKAIDEHRVRYLLGSREA